MSGPHALKVGDTIKRPLVGGTFNVITTWNSSTRNYE
jgi:hypothetical protein